jgi:hypothetical protein
MTTERSRLLDLLFGFFPAQVIQTMARLSIPDHLASGPMPIADLAMVTGTHQPSLYRLLRAGEGLDLVEQDADGTIRLAPGAAGGWRLLARDGDEMPAAHRLQRPQGGAGVSGDEPLGRLRRLCMALPAPTGCCRW